MSAVLKTPFCERLGIELPVVLAGMGGVSWPKLVAAVSNAGGLGVYGAAGLEPEQIRAHIREIKSLTDKPWALDLLVPMPGVFDAQIDVMLEEGCPIFLSALGVPTELLPRLRDAGMKIGAMVGAPKHAKKVAAAGVDFMVAQGTDAGGHTGNIGTFSLIPQVVAVAGDTPVLAAGGIAHGSQLVAALAMGAQGVVMGTRFIASDEAHALDSWKQRIVAAEASDTTLTRCYSGKQMRGFRNQYTDSWVGREAEILPFPQQMEVSLREGVLDMFGTSDDPDRGCLPTGQSCGGVHDVRPAAAIVRDFMAEAEAALRKLRPV
ncbi:nitronate monooxygenase [Immundisolibacter sp.]|uniref:NAD(P)H-dependent flavin oxidoreductase n=1 Tax=Immundisolibacter sp. TaxID=1934948 RepID=UPI002623821D|nr:nitronate monooxygenase [Immundisolibacter sp.]MDD3651374.1 nitronate monooxygenase [Immundisolibacter sp.]